ncbi:MAG: hypothetical protein HZA61_08380 [Candidatus Eisenbacteria bacterium]|uniref:Extradiol ring-cleavage dioxygenase class III enzyme subunit B domain-containing protein n=1 Tax=Eiseniibacteriota bacterium TaxID=2212470 RepID=A0A933SBW8_UNCEI|nr:hypothetical protein [Candidatus Eisenbacteria bacterium]
MLTTRAYFLPAVPTMLIDEQRGDVTEMIEALSASGDRLAAEKPDVIVALSPRWVSPGPFGVDDSRTHRSVVDLPGFGVEPRYDCPGHQALARTLVEFANKSGVRAAIARRGADSAVSIPLHFFARARRIPVVPVSIGEGTREEHRAWGAALRHALTAFDGKAAFVVGGAVQWSVHDFNLRREVEEGYELDKQVQSVLRRGAWSELERAIEDAGKRATPEASLLHLEVLRGFVLIESTPGDVLEYETSPGIGTVLAEFPLVHPESAGD